jgi:hypothetical protein
MRFDVKLLRILIIFPIVVLLFGIVGYLSSGNAQTTSNSTSLASIIHSKYGSGAEVWGETPTTLILTVMPDESAAGAIDLIKESGYKIDAVTTFVPPKGAMESDAPELYTIFFSK